MDVNMDKSLIEKLKDVIRQHYLETGERVESFYVEWAVNAIDRRPVSVSIELKK